MLHSPVLAHAAGALEVTRHEGFPAAIDAVAEAAAGEHRFLRAAWFAAVAVRGTTLVASRDGRPLAALPVVPASALPLPIGAVPGLYWPLRSFPVAADATAADLASLLGSPEARRALGMAWRLGPIAASDPTLVRLMEAAPLAGWTVLSRRLGSFFLFDVAQARREGEWPQASTRRNLHKHVKKLERIGPVTFRMVAGDQWSDAVFEDLAAIERSGWVGSRSGTDPKFLVPERLGAWRHLASDSVLGGMLSTGILSVDGKPAAFSFGINSGAVRYCIATSYDAAVARHSPGSVAGYRTYAAAADEAGIGLLNLGSGDGGEKAAMGACEGPAILDCLIVRNPLAARLLRRWWR